VQFLRKTCQGSYRIKILNNGTGRSFKSFRFVAFLFLILDFNTFYFFMDERPENHVFT